MSKAILTNVGLATIAAVTAGGGTVRLTHMAVGDANGQDTDPLPEQSALVREVWRTTINNLAPDPRNPNQMVAEMVIPADVGGFVVREVGLFDEQGTLIAIASHPAAVKPAPDSGALSEMVIRLTIIVANTADFTITIDPAIVIATRQWSQDNFSLHVLLPGGVTGQVLRKKSNAGGDVEWHDPASGMTILVNTVEENQELADGQDTIDLAVATTAQAAVYIDGLRLRADQWTAATVTRITLAAPAADGQRVTIVQNDPTSAEDYLRSVNDLSEISARGDSAKAAALYNLGLPLDGLNGLVRSIFYKLFPVGSLYLSVNTTNPSIILGIGVWYPYAKGRALVGVDETDPDFNTTGREVGEKTVTLTKAQLPNEKIDIPGVALQMDPVGDHVHTMQGAMPGGTNTGNQSGSALATLNRDSNAYGRWDSSTRAAGAHTPTGVVPSHKTGALGLGQAHNNIQPSVAVHVWQRVA
jgi:microcystin-dependent protein